VAAANLFGHLDSRLRVGRPVHSPVSLFRVDQPPERSSIGSAKYNAFVLFQPTICEKPVRREVQAEGGAGDYSCRQVRGEAGCLLPIRFRTGYEQRH
jgi:hypothetical protein